MKVRLLSLLVLVGATLILISQSITSANSAQQAIQTTQEGRRPAQDKVAPWVMEHTADGQAAEVLVILADKADLGGAKELQTKLEKGRFVRDALFAKAQQSQASLIAFLRERGVEHRAFYIVNAVWVRAAREVVMEIAARADVARIEGNPRIRNLEPVKITEQEVQAALNAVAAPTTIEPGVSYIRAPEVWSQGFNGQGIVIGGADTGVEWNHPSLVNHYRGWNGSTASHDYNWHDSVHSGGGVCGPNSPAPCDDNNHGTHTLGTAVGDDGGTNQIGVAPGAKFIACRNMDQGNGTPAMYIECMEWFLAPYPAGGSTSQGDPTKAPDITTNSWTCPPSEGCSPGTLQSAVESQRAAGIMMVVAAGNSGSACSTVSDPPSFYDASYTAGAFDSSTGTIASFSSRGPVTIDGSNRRKPDITAPGVSVRSSVRGGGYASFSGTSMATPHTAGAVALLWSAHPELRHQISDTENILDDAAVDVVTTSCGGSGVPNNVYGFGRLDIKVAVDLAAASISPAGASFGGGGGTSTVNVTAPAGVGWQTFVNDSWITVTSGGAGAGNGAVNYTVAANTGSARTGTMVIAGRVFTVTQAAPACSYSIAPTSASYSSAGGTGSVTVTASAGCAWTAASNAAWITITSGASGSGSGTVNYSVAANAGSARIGTMTIAGQTFTVTQAAACTYSISPTSQNFVTGGGTGSVNVTAGAGCGWTATSNAPWITITSGASGTGNGAVGYSVAANAGSARSGMMTIAGQTFTVTQNSGCTFAVSPTNKTFTKTGGTGTVSVTAGAGCAWTAVSNNTWITITSGANGTGNGTVGYSVMINNSGAKRTGTLTIAGKTFTVQQNKN
jgi:subtilisin family serine protease